MFDSISKSITKLFGGSKSERDVKEVMPYVQQINEHFAEYKTLSNDELRNKTQEFRARIAEFIKEETDEIASLKAQAEAEDVDIDEQEKMFNEIDLIEKKVLKKIETVLLEILPEAFAVVKETARRFTENKELVVTATQHDR
ncbi:MAG TPA: preprotein translocase subunit SecA, partial [Bacteroidia bacterium]|nr:preprotein translocase subunit SecA [Bacteroidia bacterium]